MDDSVRALRAQYGGTLPGPVEALPAPHRRDLAAALDQARSRQQRELQESTDASLAALPKPLRALIRKALGL